MIVTCEQCKTQYAVTPQAIGQSGRKVKCSKCAHVWHQEPLEKLSDTSKVQPPPKKVAKISKNANLPTITETPMASAGLKVSFAVLMICAIFLGLLANHDSFPSIAGMFGMHKTDGIVFSDFKIEKRIEDKRWQFRIDGKITNEATEQRRVPNIVATLFSKGNRKMGKLSLIPAKRILKPGETITFRPEISNISGSSYSLVIDIGNSWELSFRD